MINSSLLQETLNLDNVPLDFTLLIMIIPFSDSHILQWIQEHV